MLALKDSNLLRQACYIDGAWVGADSGETIAVTNPATDETIATVPRCGAAETERAIVAADKALKTWRETTAAERSRILRRWFDLLMAHQDDLGRLMTAEQGKPLAEAKGEIAYAAAYVEWFAEEAKRAYGEVIPSPFKDRQIVVTKEPVGVCAAITPWNFPSAMITRKVAPALAAGCTIILKPAEQTPLSALALAELAERAGVPAGVFSVVTGKASAIGGVMTASPIVRKLTFTGSTPIGQLLMQQCAGTVKKMSLELGGNAPFIVFDDADVDAAVAGALASKYRNAGQTCVCANRLIVQSGIHDAFVARLAEKAAALKVGAGDQPGVQIGPLITAKAVAKVEGLLTEAVAGGAKVVTGGTSEGQFFTPTVLTGATADMRIFREEIFGPVAPVVRFETEAEAIALANATPYGLAAYFFSRDVGRCWRVAEAIEAGMVGINEGLISTEVAPIGGVKESGLGREGGSEGLEEYFETKYLCFGGVA